MSVKFLTMFIYITFMYNPQWKNNKRNYIYVQYGTHKRLWFISFKITLYVF